MTAMVWPAGLAVAGQQLEGAAVVQAGLMKVPGKERQRRVEVEAEPAAAVLMRAVVGEGRTCRPKAHLEVVAGVKAAYSSAGVAGDHLALWVARMISAEAEEAGLVAESSLEAAGEVERA